MRNYRRVQHGLEGLERFMGAGLAVLGLLVAAALGWLVLVFFRSSRNLAVKRPKGLPKHKIAWDDEAAFDAMLTRLHGEVCQAVAHRDVETLEVISQGSALALFRSRFGGEDKREVLQGSIRQSLTGDRLVVILAVTRWAKGWKRFYDEWTLERRGAGWFIVAAKPTRLD